MCARGAGREREQLNANVPRPADYAVLTMMGMTNFIAGTSNRLQRRRSRSRLQPSPRARPALASVGRSAAFVSQKNSPYPY